MFATLKSLPRNTPGARRPWRALALTTVGIAALQAGAAFAQTAAPGTAPAPTSPSASATPAAAPAPATVTLPAPAMSTPLALNPNPYSFDVGPLGKWYVGGVLSGLAFTQNNSIAGDQNTRLDIDNGHVFVQKIDGVVQFFAEVGSYTFPTVGTSYVTAKNALNDYYGVVPQAYVKIVPDAAFAIEAGKLPTLIGAEGIYTYENMNVERGLLWNQEPVFSRGAQLTYVKDTVTINVSLNDGYYSNRYNWVSGSLAWAMNSASTLTFAGAGNLGHTSSTAFATPLAQNNSSIYNIIYTYTAGPVTITPYLQYSNIPANTDLGFFHSADTYSGAVLANYAFTPKFSLAGRGEYITTTGNLDDGAPNLLYGPGSKAFSLTLTPTYLFDRFYVRGDVSYVGISSVPDGFGFGRDGNKKGQVRGVMEVGVIF